MFKLSLALVIISGIIVLRQSSTFAKSAFSNYTVGIPVWVAPQIIRDDVDSHCDPGGPYKWSLVQEQWVSAPGAPSSTNVIGDYNVPIKLDLNWLTYRCKPNTNSVTGGTFIVDHTTPGGINGLVGTIGSMPYVATNITGYNSGVTKSFDYPAQTASNTVTIHIYDRGTVSHSDNTYKCAIVDSEGAYPTSSPTNFTPALPDHCKLSDNASSINITVPPPVTISGRVFNKDTNEGANGVGIWLNDPTVGYFGATWTKRAQKDGVWMDGVWSALIAPGRGFTVRIVNDIGVPVDPGDPGKGYKSDPKPGSSNHIPSDWFIPSSGFTNNQPENASSNSYEWQLAGKYCYQYTDASCNHNFFGDIIATWDRYDDNFNFKYINRPPSVCEVNVSKKTVIGGGSFDATFKVTNNSAANWTVGPLTSATHWLKPSDNIWGANKIQIGGGGPTLWSDGTTSNPRTETFTAPAKAGTYPFSWQVVEAGNPLDPPITCTDSIEVVNNRPYIRGSGNDIWTGMLFKQDDKSINYEPGTDETASFADVKTYNLNKNSYSAGSNGNWGQVSYGGSGVDYGIFSTGLNYSKASYSGFLGRNGTYRNFGIPTIPSRWDLIFSNTKENWLAGLYEDYGKFATEPLYIDNYYDSAIKRVGITTANTADIISAPSGSVIKYTGTELPGITIGEGKNITIVVKGNLTINGDITYQNAGPGDELGKRTGLTLIVEGNLNIKSSVNSLSGRYIVQPTVTSISSNGITTYAKEPTSGIFDTCSDMSSPPTVSDPCASKLTIKGQVITQQIRLNRLIGTIGYFSGSNRSTTGLADTGCVTPTNTNQTANDGCAAELFQFDPSTYINASSGTVSNNPGPSVQSRQELPPIY